MEIQSTLLSPGRRVLASMRFGKKFLLVGIVFLIPIAFLLTTAYKQLDGDIRLAGKDLSCLKLIGAAGGGEQDT